MTEDQKIKQIIAQYGSYFKHSSADVGHTEKGVWFFYEYDKEHDYYNSFIRFTTAEELTYLIASHAADEIGTLIEVEAENVYHALQEIEINDALESRYDMCIPMLLKDMEVLNQECQKGMEKMDVIYRSFSGILERMQNEN